MNSERIKGYVDWIEGQPGSSKYAAMAGHLELFNMDNSPGRTIDNWDLSSDQSLMQLNDDEYLLLWACFYGRVGMNARDIERAMSKVEQEGLSIAEALNEMLVETGHAGWTDFHEHVTPKARFLQLKRKGYIHDVEAMRAAKNRNIQKKKNKKKRKNKKH